MTSSIVQLIKTFLSLLLNHAVDLLRYFVRSASAARPMSDDQLRARLLQRAHSIEKGLSLPVVRPVFGVAHLEELQSLLREYEDRGLGEGEVAYRSARSAVSAYLDFHAQAGYDLPSRLAFVRQLGLDSYDSAAGGTLRLRADDIKREARGDFRSLVNARHSTRMFGTSVPDLQLIEAAIQLAGRSPSVCNRQGGRIHLVTERDLLSRVLEIQGGAKGFEDQIPVIAVVTCAISVFRGARERNQCWVDGGLFAMTLLYALTFAGLGTCPLNWSSTFRQDRRMREIVGIPPDENIVMLVAVGELLDEYRVASSPRLPLSSILRADAQ